MKTRVLVIDDSLTVRMDLKDAFEDAGFDVTLCSTAREARATLARERFSLLVLDVLLPDADGVELLAEVRATSSTPVILLSSEAEVRDRIRGLRTGASEYVGKPYDTAYITARAKELIRSGEAPVAHAETTVLVVDDSVTFRETLKERLESAGYAVAVASGGAEGLRMAAELRPAAVIVDGVMPEIDGVTVIRRLRLDAMLRTTPCILLTASDDRDDELRALDSGADAFVRKDEDTDLVLARLAAIVRGATPADLEAPASVLGPKKILAVDDSATYLHELSEQLTREGYDVVLARSGEEALELLAIQSVDCILLDVVMPGLSGHETCMRIKASPVTRDIPLVMLTAHEDLGAMLEGMNAGADDYIPKSNDFEVLRARLRAQLRRKQFEDDNRRLRDQLAVRALADARALLLADLERKNIELAAATRELEAFSYSVSHDLRAPLRAVDGFARVLLEDHHDALGDEGRRVVGVICKNTEKMAKLIDDLLEFSRAIRKTSARKLVDMTAMVGDVAEEVMEPGRRIDLRVADLPRAYADESLVRQVWSNLLGNAVKYTRPREHAVVDVTGEIRGTEVVYTVRDNGVGFDSRYADKLFGVFQRLHAASEFEGTGVGLALVRRIIERHGGWIKGESVLGQGATFRFALPNTENRQ